MHQVGHVYAYIFVVLDPSQFLTPLIGAVSNLLPSLLFVFVRGQCMITNIRIIQRSASLILLIKITINMKILHVTEYIFMASSRCINRTSKNVINGDNFLRPLSFTHDE